MANTSVNFDGVNHDVDPVIASLISGERKRYDAQIAQVKQDAEEALVAKKTAEAELEKTKGELAGVQQKLEESQKVDHSQEMVARLDAWAAVLPSIEQQNPNFKVDYSQTVNGIKKLYLQEVHGKGNLDKASDDYIDGLYEALAPIDEQTPSRLDSQSKTLDNVARVDGRGTSGADVLTARRKSRKLKGYTGGKM